MSTHRPAYRSRTDSADRGAGELESLGGRDDVEGLAGGQFGRPAGDLVDGVVVVAGIVVEEHEQNN